MLEPSDLYTSVSLLAVRAVFVVPPVVLAISRIVVGSGGTGIELMYSPKPNETTPFGVPSATV
jgi:hypothetical protein